MKIKTSKHARGRLKYRFKNIPSFGEELDDKKLKYINKSNGGAEVYKYDLQNNPMYLLIGKDKKIPEIITIFTPTMYKSWETRYKIFKGIKIISKFFGISGQKSYKTALRISNWMIPKID